MKVVKKTSKPATVFAAVGLTPRLLKPVTVTTCSCVTLIPIVVPLMIGLLYSGGRLSVGVGRRRGGCPSAARVGGLHILGVVFPVMIAAMITLFIPDTIPLVNVLVFNGLIGRVKAGAFHLFSTTSGDVVGTTAVFLKLSINTAVATRTFLGFAAVNVMVKNFLTFTLSVTNNVFFIGLFGLFAGGGVGPLVKTAKLDTMPVTSHITGRVTLGCSPGGRILRCYVTDGVSNIVNSTMTTNMLVSFLKWFRAQVVFERKFRKVYSGPYLVWRLPTGCLLPGTMVPGCLLWFIA